MTEKFGWRASVAMWSDDLTADLRSVEFDIWHLDLEIFDTHISMRKKLK
jgi:hypothetical protein